MTSSHVAATVPLPPPVARPQDAQLRQDVRWLAATLGRVVGRLAGEDTFRAVEELRRACRARRLGVPGAPDLDALLARTRALPPETARLTARAFTVFFILINAAEQAHRVRRSRQDDLAAAQRGSVRWSLRRLREAGHGAEEVARALLTLDVRPVLTAHPTESARRTRSEEHTSELQSQSNLVCRLLLEKKKKQHTLQRQLNYSTLHPRCTAHTPSS